MRIYIKDLKPGDLFVMVAGTVYEATRVRSESGRTSVTYTVLGSHMRDETTFTRVSLTTCEIVS